MWLFDYNSPRRNRAEDSDASSGFRVIWVVPGMLTRIASAVRASKHFQPITQWMQVAGRSYLESSPVQLPKFELVFGSPQE